MSKLLNYLSTHRTINLIVAGIYYLLAVLPHEQVGVFIAKNIMKPLGRKVYDRTMLQIAVAGLLLYAIVVVWNIIRKPNQYPTFIYLIYNVFFAFCSWYALFVLNIEAIHFLQYAILAILLFPLIRRYEATLFWCTLLGAIDEAYQYFYLAPNRTDYYDFNDVILDLIGAAFGLILIRSFNPKLSTGKTWFNKPIAMTMAGLSLIIGLLHLFGKLRFYPDTTVNAWFTLVKKPPTDFWSQVPPKITFHIVEPLEGMVLIGVLLLFFMGLKVGAKSAGGVGG